MADGRERTVRTNAATVREAVAEAGITLHGEDTTSVDPHSFPRDGQTVSVMRITDSREVHEEPVPYAEQRSEDDSILAGTEVVEREGRPGVRRITYGVRTVNGVRQRPRALDAEVVRTPVDRIVKVGTGAGPRSVAGAGGLNWAGLASCESGGRPRAVDAGGTYGGLYQFDTRTWHSLGGSGRPQDAPASEQTFRAKKLYLQRGRARGRIAAVGLPGEHHRARRPPGPRRHPRPGRETGVRPTKQRGQNFVIDANTVRRIVRTRRSVRTTWWSRSDPVWAR